MAHQYTKAQEDYFEKAFDFWFERCNASTAKTLEFTTEATKLSFDYKVLWVGSEDSFELCIDGFKLVPHLPEYFLDNLHPNQLGTEVYARNLVREIERLGF